MLMHQHNCHRAIFDRAVKNFDSGDGEIPMNKLIERVVANSKEEMNTQKQNDIRFPTH